MRHRRDSSLVSAFTDGRARHARPAARPVRPGFSDPCPENRPWRIDLAIKTWSLSRCFAARVRRASGVRVSRATDAGRVRRRSFVFWMILSTGKTKFPYEHIDRRSRNI